MALLITPSLYESYRWFRQIEDKPLDELVSTLHKAKSPPNDAMLAGIAFEDHVRGVAAPDASPAYMRCVKEVSDIVGDGLWQQSFDKIIIISGREYLLYCRSDVVRRNWIYDVKFSQSYDIGKYFPSVQHLITMKTSGVDNFGYVVSDGRSVYREDYFWHEGCDALLIERLSDMLLFFESVPSLKAAYHENWQSKWQ